VKTCTNLSVFCAYSKVRFGEKFGENTGLKAGGETEQALSLQKTKAKEKTNKSVRPSF
jgi:hypothetical protein